MYKIKKLLKSRSFYSLLALFLLGGLQNISDIMPEQAYLLISGILTTLVAYFKANPSQRYD